MERVWDAKHSRPQSSVLSGIDWQWAERQEFDFCQRQCDLACAEHSILFKLMKTTQYISSFPPTCERHDTPYQLCLYKETLFRTLG